MTSFSLAWDIYLPSAIKGIKSIIIIIHTLEGMHVSVHVQNKLLLMVGLSAEILESSCPGNLGTISTSQSGNENSMNHDYT